MKERWRNIRVALGVLILASAFVGNRGVVNQENSPAKAAQPPQSLFIPPTLRSLMFEIGGYVIPEKLGVRSYPSANKFD
ncbi:hypothetical protein A3C59_02410 [Candidatus Daviesbacteria bacterium RIFCSPHIGHO2_02_FULL_36_13]|uniref:Uncharacterized protein n=1 Tax=Candidatus Daviesbacteria bacterium RIFCSPHIGHO2_02_FULL_36_13 TaxID=1797768 RepID=A0A1F5JS66_9BACT|nr:MAG: hypothetical protein A3C59_02410 [Candidatus Daviesbacteria bacterium RIFCSPHIGHO2_02_FULL_36_13]